MYYRIGQNDFAGFGDDLSSAVSVGQGALALAVGRARAVSGLPISFEEAARSVMDAVEGPGASAAAGLVGSVRRAGEIFAENIRQAASDVGSNLSEVAEGFRVLRSAYTPEGNELAARVSAILGGGAGVDATTYSVVYVGTLLYQQGVFDSLLSTVKSAVLDSEALTKIGSALGISGTASPAAGAFIGAAVSTLTTMWEAFKDGISIKIGKEPPGSYWGKVTTAIYAWDGSGCGPSWPAVRDRNDPVFDPILREWQVITDYTMAPKRLVDVYGRAKLRGGNYMGWILISEGARCPSVSASPDDSEPRYNPMADGGIYNPSAWPPNEATRMRGLLAPFYCAHAAKVDHWCDGSGRINNICVAARQIGPGSDHDLSWTLRGALVAAAYLGSNVSGIQNLGSWDSPNCGYGSGTYIPGRFWDLGIGGTRSTSGTRSNWIACVLSNGQVLLRPPIAVDSQLSPESTTLLRRSFLNKGVWYPMFQWAEADAIDWNRITAGWRPLYANVDARVGEMINIPLTVSNGIAQQSPVTATPQSTFKLASLHPSMKPMLHETAYQSGDIKTEGDGVSTGTKVALVLGGLALAVGGYLWWKGKR